jgi:membrane protease YdiL (CAAX protease family)
MTGQREQGGADGFVGESGRRGVEGRGGWPVPALLMAVPVIYGLGALGGMLAAWALTAWLRIAQLVPADMRLMELLTSKGIETSPHAPYHFALVGVLFAGNGLVTGLLVLAISRWSLAGGVAAALPFARLRPATLALLALVAPIIHGLGFAIVYSFAGQDIPAEIGFDPLDPRMWAYPLAIVVFAPLSEEIVFRGWLFAGIAGRIRNPLWVIVLTSLFWAMVHTGQGFAKAAALVPVGLAFGLMRHRTQSLWPSICGHMLTNALGLGYMTWLAQ